MNQVVTTGIVLARIDYGEADRIVTFLTPDVGKLRLMAKGVRKIRSKLAGGIELFSVSDITFIRGRGDIGRLVSARLERHYGDIVKSIEQVQLGYECIRLLGKNTEDEPETGYFFLLDQTFAALNDPNIEVEHIRVWFLAQLLRLGGLVPNMQSDTQGQKLNEHEIYTFSFEDMGFVTANNGRIVADHIKVLRLIFGNYTPGIIQKLRTDKELIAACSALVQTMFSTSLRI